MIEKCPKCGEKIKSEENLSLAQPILVLMIILVLFVVSLFLQK